MENEVWRDIESYEGLYQVSNLGRIKSSNRKIYSDRYKNGIFVKEKIRKNNIDKYGYNYIILYKKGKNKTYKIHRLVAQAFIPNPNNYPCINHKNKIRNDNRVENLEWCDVKYNNQFSRGKSVVQYDLRLKYIKKWNCIREAGRILNIDNRDICKCCKGKLKTAGNYIWRYAEIEKVE